VQTYGTCEFLCGLLSMESGQVREVWKKAPNAGGVPFGRFQET